MSIFKPTLGGQQVTVIAPECDHFDAEAFIATFPEGGLYGLDVEGTYMGPLAQWDPNFELRLAQFATTDTAWVLNMTDPNQRRAAIELLGNKATWFCSHSPMDVLAVFVRLGVDITLRNVDTLVLARMADPDSLFGNDLKTLSGKYVGPELVVADEVLDAKFIELWRAAGGKGAPKRKVKYIDEEDGDEKEREENLAAKYGWSAISDRDQDYLVYAGLDAIVCRRLLPLLAAETHAPRELLDVEVWLAGQANRIQIRGMLVDLDKLNALYTEAVTIVEQAEAVVRKLTAENPPAACESWDRKTDKEKLAGLPTSSPNLRPHTVNVQAPNGKTLTVEDGEHRKNCKKEGCPGCLHYVNKQCCSGWLAQHGVDWSVWPGEMTDTGQPSFKKNNLEHLAGYDLDEVGQQVFEALRKHRKVHDQKNKTAGVKAGLDANGRIHPTLKTVQAVTGRMSSTGPNFQNFSKTNPELRGMFLPDPGCTFITADFDQVELRVVAALAREQKMIDTILAGGDLHDLTVQELAKVGVEITRDTAKMTNFLIVYGGGGPALSSQAGIPLQEAYQIVETFRSRYTKINELSEKLGREKEFVVNIAGRRIPVTTAKKTGKLRSYANINYVVQSSARELLVHAWHRFAVEFGRGDLVWFPIHDEMVLQVPNNLIEVVMKEIETCMRFDFMGVPISASAIPLLEPDGTSRWMTSKLAEKYAEARELANA